MINDRLVSLSLLLAEFQREEKCSAGAVEVVLSEVMDVIVERVNDVEQDLRRIME